MTAPSHLSLAGQPVGRWRLRRLSRQFAGVGVNVTADRLAQIAAGHPVSDDELIDVAFAEAATRIRGEQRRARRGRAKRSCVRSAVMVAGTVVALNLLLCLGLAFFLLAEHSSPF